jgi:AraC family transcriptional regulator
VKRILLKSAVSDLNETADLADRSAREPAATAAARRPIAGIGRVLLWSGGSLWIGRDAGRGDTHAHHAIQIALSMDSHFRMASGESGWREHRGAIVMPHRPHRFDGCGQRMAMIFVEPETAPGRALLARYGTADIADLGADAAEALVGPLRAGYLAAATTTR